jgi:putative addiction module killer protein
MLKIRYYVAASGQEPFAEWFAELDGAAAAKIARALARMEQSVGEGVLEHRVDFGPGYRIYFGRDGDTIVILLTGGTKRRQQRDIDEAHTSWRDYKRSRRGRVRMDRD